jgi:hypothetical protein
MEPQTLHPLRWQPCYVFFSSLKVHRPRPGVNSRTLGQMTSTITTIPSKATGITYWGPSSFFQSLYPIAGKYLTIYHDYYFNLFAIHCLQSSQEESVAAECLALLLHFQMYTVKTVKNSARRSLFWLKSFHGFPLFSLKFWVIILKNLLFFQFHPTIDAMSRMLLLKRR